MKIALFVAAIAAAAATAVGGVLALLSLRKQASEADQAPTWGDVEQIRKLALGVDNRMRWVAWLTLVNALLSFVLAFTMLQND
ncbi:hypothetical protein CP967_08580 [Streptomyces nitrosporeus]|uniref:Uncharacterized protein n=1 Tax=Streptomyces nitrosporeus TaxID=28894 RepID=A0A5J6F869_9ACTN|nr:hypothetical protein [Streptomyces nitrosporeus]QEU72017.1 hypothetical protein CP967_08580 [Streptomyces nitrosporeus]GGY81244.1 hypothetical protein GCM10010327_09850 [Streptomyces nitrosporeus]